MTNPDRYSELEQDLAVVESRLHDAQATIAELQQQIKKLSDDLIAESERRKQLALVVAALAPYEAMATQDIGYRADLADIETDAQANSRR